MKHVHYLASKARAFGKNLNDEKPMSLLLPWGHNQLSCFLYAARSLSYHPSLPAINPPSHHQSTTNPQSTTNLLPTPHHHSALSQSTSTAISASSLQGRLEPLEARVVVLRGFAVLVHREEVGAALQQQP